MASAAQPPPAPASTLQGSGTKVEEPPAAPATVQKPRRRSDLNLDAAPAVKRKRPEVGTDPDALKSRGFELFDVKIIETIFGQLCFLLQ